MKRGSLVVLTGAGISAESGIRTFRDQYGLWEDHAIDDVASPEGFARDPELVHRFYNARRAQLLSSEVAPNAAHLALSDLERAWNGPFLLVTQNVDNLHERAGSRALIHMHGELLKMRCTKTGHVFECNQRIGIESRCACCGETGSLRPHIVWFGETPLEMDAIYAALAGCEIFVAIGTSGHVFPAAGFVDAVPPGARSIEINREASAVSSRFRERRVGLAGILVPALVRELLM